MTPYQLKSRNDNVQHTRTTFSTKRPIKKWVLLVTELSCTGQLQFPVPSSLALQHGCSFKLLIFVFLADLGLLLAFGAVDVLLPSSCFFLPKYKSNSYMLLCFILPNTRQAQTLECRPLLQWKAKPDVFTNYTTLYYTRNHQVSLPDPVLTRILRLSRAHYKGKSSVL
jgi:hypothetical protein